MQTLGCDPGLFGAVALYDDTLDVLAVRDMPVARVRVGRSASRVVLVDAELARLMRELAPDRIVIEDVHGIKGQSASASFNFGAAFGVLRGVAATMGVPVHFASPQAWRMKLSVPRGKDGSRLRACQLYPRHAGLFSRVKDDGRAEAALIARLKI